MKMSQRKIPTYKPPKQKVSDVQQSLQQQIIQDDFSDAIYDEFRKKEQEDKNSYLLSEDIIGLPCKKCGSRSTVYKDIHTRSLDEGGTDLITCLVCKMRGK
jgi:DNA-directed RNA polymerase subunit M/transcription elongation factor TFIIS